MVRLPLGGARGHGGGGWRSLRLPEGLEGRVVQTLLRQVALGRSQQQQVLEEEEEEAEMEEEEEGEKEEEEEEGKEEEKRRR